jgi:hypothetical protein
LRGSLAVHGATLLVNSRKWNYRPSDIGKMAPPSGSLIPAQATPDRGGCADHGRPMLSAFAVMPESVAAIPALLWASDQASHGLLHHQGREAGCCLFIVGPVGKPAAFHSG